MQNNPSSTESIIDARGVFACVAISGSSMEVAEFDLRSSAFICVHRRFQMRFA
jgi:hypothetical protein